jgi:hypothetical protein
MHLEARAGRIYVAEYLNDRVQVFSPSGESLGWIGGPGGIDAAAGVAVDGGGRLRSSSASPRRLTPSASRPTS